VEAGTGAAGYLSTITARAGTIRTNNVVTGNVNAVVGDPQLFGTGGFGLCRLCAGQQASRYTGNYHECDCYSSQDHDVSAFQGNGGFALIAEVGSRLDSQYGYDQVVWPLPVQPLLPTFVNWNPC
jgi:hypothetical protein